MSGNLIFLDSNVIIYAVASSCPKKQVALDLLCQDNAIISTQVINECSNILRKKFKFNYPRIAETLKHYLDMVQTVNFDFRTIENAWVCGEKYGFSYYDSLIISTALENNCTLLYSEDMQHKQIIEEQLTIINPFL